MDIDKGNIIEDLSEAKRQYKMLKEFEGNADFRSFINDKNKIEPFEGWIKSILLELESTIGALTMKLEVYFNDK